MTPAEASNLLVRKGAQFVEEALRDNPDGPVKMVIDISRTEINYDVVIGDPEDSMSPRGARTIWHKTVYFGSSDRHCAGGAAFVEASREQDAVAFAALELLESRR
ncbi:MAG TPA: hypothetical protein VFQ42_22455 [Mycobacterium sp.]|nr:hypothetical protein [Mycobacterium sp.]